MQLQVAVVILFLTLDLENAQAGIEQLNWSEVTLRDGVVTQERQVTSKVKISPLGTPIRRRREIYPPDDRVLFNATTNQLYPYSSVVKLSTGCTGILIGRQHVLTAAHCVHDRTRIKTRYLRVGYLDDSGKFVWYFAKKIFYPRQWTFQMGNRLWADYDYAVVKVPRKISKKRGFIPPGLSVDDLHGEGDTIYFIGFPDDKPQNQTWGATCSVLSAVPSLLYFECDAIYGVSGSGIYTWEDNCNTTKKPVRRVVGVLSGNRQSKLENRRYNVGVRLSPLRYIQVCKWIRQEQKCKSRYKEYFDDGIVPSDDCLE